MEQPNGVQAEIETLPAQPTFSPKLRVRANQPGARRLGQYVAWILRQLGRPHVVVLCIGNDQSTGDALGPLVGTLLMRRKAGRLPQVRVFGTLDEPVNTCNCASVVEAIYRFHAGCALIAVDAALGRRENIGTITVGLGPLQPAAWSDKKLPQVGDVFVIGTVCDNPNGFLPHFVLQTTPLGLVLRMAEVIASGLSNGIRTFLASNGSKGS